MLRYHAGQEPGAPAHFATIFREEKRVDVDPLEARGTTEEGVERKFAGNLTGWPVRAVLVTLHAND